LRRVAWPRAYAFDRQDLFATLDDLTLCVASSSTTAIWMRSGPVPASGH
jgi:hypothetical protein